MLFGSQHWKLNLALQGVKIEQVESIKYLGVWLDTHLTFLQQTEYATSKASKAYWKVNRLIDGRRGLTPKTGIELYKSLIRPCWEFSIAAWATTSEKGIKLLEPGEVFKSDSWYEIPHICRRTRCCRECNSSTATDSVYVHLRVYQNIVQASYV